jgi:5-formyltetrahydrofolate cyclo-ligase
LHSQPSFTHHNFYPESLNSLIQPNEVLLSYRGIHPEIDPFLWESILITKLIFYPRVFGNQLHFVRPVGWQKSKWGYDPIGEEQISLKNADWVIIPALGWNQKGFRLGRGGGFYDRSFKEFPRHKIIGLTRNSEFPIEFPEEPWDIRAGRILSEDRVHSFL